MSDTPENTPSAQPGPQERQDAEIQQRPEPNEKVGDLLRKERVTRRITVETIAKDLKLNANYIKALEANDYDQLPAAPYVRVYLKSIAAYLMLDPEDVLKKFYRDRGLGEDAFKEDRSTQMTISLKDKQTSPVPWIVLAIVVLFLVGLGYLGMKQGWITTGGKIGTTVPTDNIHEDSMGEAVEPVDEYIDTTTAMPPTQPPAGAQEETEELQETIEDEPQTQAAPGDSFRLVIQAKRDSVWVHVFTDGQSWKNFIHAGNSRVFRAKDSLNVHVGYNALLNYTLNQEPLKVRGKGVAFFKLDAKGIHYWKYSKWRSALQGKL